MTENQMLNAVKAKCIDAYLTEGKDRKELVIVRKSGRIVAEYDNDDNQRMAHLAKTYGVTE